MTGMSQPDDEVDGLGCLFGCTGIFLLLLVLGAYPVVGCLVLLALGVFALVRFERSAARADERATEREISDARLSDALSAFAPDHECATRVLRVREPCSLVPTPE